MSTEQELVAVTVELEAEQHERLRRYCAEVNARYDLELPTWAVLEALVASWAATS